MNSPGLDSEGRVCAGFNARADSIPAMNLPMRWEFRRQRRLEIDLFLGDGVEELQELGVQEVSSVAGKAGEAFKRQAG
jgi:hypothetical protein